jgi:hypothetical protein
VPFLRSFLERLRISTCALKRVRGTPLTTSSRLAKSNHVAVSACLLRTYLTPQSIAWLTPFFLEGQESPPDSFTRSREDSGLPGFYSMTQGSHEKNLRGTSRAYT